MTYTASCHQIPDFLIYQPKYSFNLILQHHLQKHAMATLILVTVQRLKNKQCVYNSDQIRG